MKTSIKKFAALLTIGTLPMLGVNAQVKVAVENQAYVLTSTENPSLANGATIQWYRNDVAIPNCTTPTCTVPADLCSGENVRFYRRVTDNATSVTFKSSAVSAADSKCGDGNGTKIGDLCWADRNADGNQTFAVNLTFTAKPDDYGKFYQWNRSTAWAATEVVIDGWTTTSITDASWTVNPCPTGWRLPTSEEFKALNSAGSTLANANAKGNAVTGRFFGANHATCSLPSNMGGCIFLPAAGNRNNRNGLLSGQGNSGYYWSSTQSQSEAFDGYYLNFNMSSVNPAYSYSKARGNSVRCVQ